MASLPLSKPCSRCGQTKPLHDFRINAKGKYGRSAPCKACYLAKRPPQPALDLEGEVWKPIVGFPDYSVSNMGRVRRETYGGGSWPKRLLAPRLANYYQVFLAGESGIKTIAVHTLVMRAFVGPRPEGMHVDHIDGCKTNNKLENLEYVTGRENTRRAIELGNMNTAGENHSLHILKDTQVYEIRRLADERQITLTAIAERFGVSLRTISLVYLRQSWKHLPERGAEKMNIDIYGGKDPRDLPMFNRTAAARWLKLAQKTVANWAPKRDLTFFEMYDMHIRRTVAGSGYFEMDDENRPTAYHPVEGVTIDPRVAFGRPTMAGTGINTSTIKYRIEGGETPEQIAEDFDVNIEAVRAAANFEAPILTPPTPTEPKE